ncbi:IBR domain, a half RING-finger domain-containing protein [Ditylenchus destructor]|uniref:RBR-type E3 ubiquitin transferase n=1 Tax=Ditylenchus destructor TaxID=166010 RepID=A0AAD4NAS7_9BILA|nr:IBR domain, a half RING-finger domain-containing protein [Ditylenchus destructor]
MEPNTASVNQTKISSMSPIDHSLPEGTVSPVNESATSTAVSESQNHPVNHTPGSFVNSGNDEEITVLSRNEEIQQNNKSNKYKQERKTSGDLKQVKKGKSGTGPFSASRLSLIAFLNNIATSSSSSYSSKRRGSRSRSLSNAVVIGSGPVKSRPQQNLSSGTANFSGTGSSRLNSSIAEFDESADPEDCDVDRDANLERSFASMKPESEGPGFHWQERESEQLVVVELDNAADQIVPLKGAHMPATQDAMGIAAENAPSEANVRSSIDPITISNGIDLETKSWGNVKAMDGDTSKCKADGSSNPAPSGNSCCQISLNSSNCACSASICSATSSLQHQHSCSNGDRASLTNGSSAKKGPSKECPICYNKKPLSSFPDLLTSCGHRSCRSCLLKYLRMEIMESRTAITCPECAEPFHVNDIYTLLNRSNTPELIERYECFALRRVLSTDPDTRWCPAPDCTYAVIANSCAACPQLQCERPECGAMFCYHCKNYWHANQTCDEARQDFLRDLIEAVNGGPVGNSKNFVKAGSRGGDRIKPGDVMKSCPRCGALIVKMNDGSCNHMVCALCGVEFCWLCLKQINELHYLSPTGCTFWGKKPWTRKKKLLWQIGTLIGAPLGIALIAGLAVPGIICGVPIFVGRKTYQRFANMTRTKRHLITATAVTGSLLVSPVLAVMAVGVGVPIMLAYVYGVVPLSLCRNGGCGGGGANGDAGSPAVHNDNSDSSPIDIDVEAAYGDEDTDDIDLLTNAYTEAQERSRLLRELRDGADMNASSSKKKSSDGTCKGSMNHKKQKIEATLSQDRSATSSPSSGSSQKVRRFSSGLNHKHGNECSRIAAKSSSGGGSLGAATAESNHRRQSTESGINSLGDKVNTEDASVKAIAGSQYNYDDRSMWSNGGGMGPHYEVASYNEDEASTRACGGSVMESRSLANESLAALSAAGGCMTASTPSAHLSLLSRERDISPTIIPTGTEAADGDRPNSHKQSCVSSGSKKGCGSKSKMVHSATSVASCGTTGNSREILNKRSAKRRLIHSGRDTVKQTPSTANNPPTESRGFTLRKWIRHPLAMFSRNQPNNTTTMYAPAASSSSGTSQS